MTPLVHAMDVHTALREAMGRLGEARVPSHTLAAELLLMHVLGRDRAWLYSHAEDVLDAASAERYFDLVARRIAGTPTQYLTGHQEFWGLDFLVEPGVLIPRPETEHLVETVLEWLGGRRWGSDIAGRQLHLADVGTGSGCLALALAYELPEADIIATDISLQALALARRNAERHGFSSRIHLVRCNLLDALECGGSPPLCESGSKLPHSKPVFQFDLIVSNPPYVARKEAALLPREVREHEPAQALFSGENGLELYAPLIEQAGALLRPGGLLALELGYGASEKAVALLREGWRNVRVRPDLADIPRVLSAEKL